MSYAQFEDFENTISPEATQVHDSSDDHLTIYTSAYAFSADTNDDEKHVEAKLANADSSGTGDRAAVASVYAAYIADVSELDISSPPRAAASSTTKLRGSDERFSKDLQSTMTTSTDGQRSEESSQQHNTGKQTNLNSQFSQARGRSEGLQSEIMFDWQSQFEAILETALQRPEGVSPDSPDFLRYRLARALALRELFSRFCEEAKIIAQRIVEESALPTAQRTYQPLTGYGIAGGEKYCVNGFFIKLTRDVAGIYGGDQGAIKAAKHEIRSLQALIGCEVPGLLFPMVAVIDYLGLRLVFTSLIQGLSEFTLVYGSQDAGRTIYCSNTSLNAKVRLACLRLGLGAHTSIAVQTSTGQLMYGPVDLEGHAVPDPNVEDPERPGKTWFDRIDPSLQNKYYLLDFARLFPPSSPTIADDPKSPYFLYFPGGGKLVTNDASEVQPSNSPLDVPPPDWWSRVPFPDRYASFDSETTLQTYLTRLLADATPVPPLPTTAESQHLKSVPAFSQCKRATWPAGWCWRRPSEQLMVPADLKQLHKKTHILSDGTMVFNDSPWAAENLELNVPATRYLRRQLGQPLDPFCEFESNPASLDARYTAIRAFEVLRGITVDTSASFTHTVADVVAWLKQDGHECVYGPALILQDTGKVFYKLLRPELLRIFRDYNAQEILTGRLNALEARKVLAAFQRQRPDLIPAFIRNPGAFAARLAYLIIPEHIPLGHGSLANDLAFCDGVTYPQFAKTCMNLAALYLRAHERIRDLIAKHLPTAELETIAWLPPLVPDEVKQSILNGCEPQLKEALYDASFDHQDEEWLAAEGFASQIVAACKASADSKTPQLDFMAVEELFVRIIEYRIQTNEMAKNLHFTQHYLRTKRDLRDGVEVQGNERREIASLSELLAVRDPALCELDAFLSPLLPANSTNSEALHPLLAEPRVDLSDSISLLSSDSYTGFGSCRRDVSPLVLDHRCVHGGQRHHELVDLLSLLQVGFPYLGPSNGKSCNVSALYSRIAWEAMASLLHESIHATGARSFGGIGGRSMSLDGDGRSREEKSNSTCHGELSATGAKLDASRQLVFGGGTPPTYLIDLNGSGTASGGIGTFGSMAWRPTPTFSDENDSGWETVGPRYGSSICSFLAAEMCNHTISVTDGDSLASVMHRVGLNLRCMGVLIDFLTEPSLIRLVLDEALARSAKVLLTNRFRAVTTEFQSRQLIASSNQAPDIAADIPQYADLLGALKKECAQFFNLMFGFTERSSEFWEDQMRVMVDRKFYSRKLRSLQNPKCDLRTIWVDSRGEISSTGAGGDYVQYPLLRFSMFMRVQELTGVKFKEESMRRLLTRGEAAWAQSTGYLALGPINPDDVDEILPQAKTSSFDEDMHAYLQKLAEMDCSPRLGESPRQSVGILGQLFESSVTMSRADTVLEQYYRNLVVVFGFAHPEAARIAFKLGVSAAQQLSAAAAVNPTVIDPAQPGRLEVTQDNLTQLAAESSRSLFFSNLQTALEVCLLTAVVLQSKLGAYNPLVVQSLGYIGEMYAYSALSIAQMESKSSYPTTSRVGDDEAFTTAINYLQKALQLSRRLSGLHPVQGKLCGLIGRLLLLKSDALASVANSAEGNSVLNLAQEAHSTRLKAVAFLNRSHEIFSTFVGSAIASSLGPVVTMAQGQATAQAVLNMALSLKQLVSQVRREFTLIEEHHQHLLERRLSNRLSDGADIRSSSDSQQEEDDALDQDRDDDDEDLIFAPLIGEEPHDSNSDDIHLPQEIKMPPREDSEELPERPSYSRTSSWWRSDSHQLSDDYLLNDLSIAAEMKGGMELSLGTSESAPDIALNRHTTRGQKYSILVQAALSSTNALAVKAYRDIAKRRKRRVEGIFQRLQRTLHVLEDLEGLRRGHYAGGLLDMAQSHGRKQGSSECSNILFEKATTEATQSLGGTSIPSIPNLHSSLISTNHALLRFRESVGISTMSLFSRPGALYPLQARGSWIFGPSLRLRSRRTTADVIKFHRANGSEASMAEFEYVVPTPDAPDEAGRTNMSEAEYSAHQQAFSAPFYGVTAAGETLRLYIWSLGEPVVRLISLEPRPSPNTHPPTLVNALVCDEDPSVDELNCDVDLRLAGNSSYVHFWQRRAMGELQPPIPRLYVALLQPTAAGMQLVQVQHRPPLLPEDIPSHKEIELPERKSILFPLRVTSAGTLCSVHLDTRATSVTMNIGTPAFIDLLHADSFGNRNGFYRRATPLLASHARLTTIFHSTIADARFKRMRPFRGLPTYELVLPLRFALHRRLGGTPPGLSMTVELIPSDMNGGVPIKHKIKLLSTITGEFTVEMSRYGQLMQLIHLKVADPNARQRCGRQVMVTPHMRAARAVVCRSCAFRLPPSKCFFCRATIVVLSQAKAVYLCVICANAPRRCIECYRVISPAEFNDVSACPSCFPHGIVQKCPGYN